MKGLVGLLLAAGCAAGIAAEPTPRRSGYEDMARSTQALQDDDSQNPATLWVQDGEQRFAADCARCHDEQFWKVPNARVAHLHTRLPLTGAHLRLTELHRGHADDAERHERARRGVAHPRVHGVQEARRHRTEDERGREHRRRERDRAGERAR